MVYPLPPPVFRYDIADAADLHRRISRFRDHSALPVLEVKEVLVAQDAILHLPEMLSRLGAAPGGKVLVIKDATPMYRAGAELKPLVSSLLQEAGYAVQELVLAGDEYGLVHADFHQVEMAFARLEEGMTVVSVGTGVVTDVGKHACFLYREKTGEDLLLAACMTACSVPAYTSQSSIITKSGVKRTWPSRTPDGILVDLQTLRDAPYTYTLGGLGDTIPIFAAFADWYLADALGFSKVTDAPWRICDDIRDLLLPYVGEIAARSSAGMEVLSKFIHNVGLCMSFARETAPASGYEHLISHMLDMSADYDKRKVGSHGQQVGIATVLSLIHFDKVICCFDEIYAGKRQLDIESCFPNEETCRAHIIEAFGAFGEAQREECWSDFEIKLKTWSGKRDALRDFMANWEKHKAALKFFMPFSAEECAGALDLAGHPLTFEGLPDPVRESRGKWALRYANLMRKRFTSADLVYFFGWMDDAWIDDIFAGLYKINNPGRG